MRKVFFTLTFMVLFAAVGVAQDASVVPPITPAPVASVAQDKDTRFSILVGYSGNEFKPNPTEAAEYANAVWFEANGRIYAKGKFRLDGTVNFRRTFDQTLESEYPVPPEGPLPASLSLIAIRRDVDTVSVGPKVSYGIAGPVRVYGAALFGFKNLKFDPTTGDGEYRQFSRRYQFGADLELGHFVVRPFYYEKEFTKGLLASSTDSYGAGVGFRF